MQTLLYSRTAEKGSLLGNRIPLRGCHIFDDSIYKRMRITVGFDPLSRFFRESDEPRSGSRPDSRVSFQAAEAYSTRCLNKSNFPRPYIERLMNLSLFTRPSVCPWLYGRIIPATTASMS
jgi:hypothetical protein